MASRAVELPNELLALNGKLARPKEKLPFRGEKGSFGSGDGNSNSPKVREVRRGDLMRGCGYMGHTENTHVGPRGGAKYRRVQGETQSRTQHAQHPNGPFLEVGGGSGVEREACQVR